MSKDKMPAILNAVNALPVRQRGLALGLLSTLCEGVRFPNAPKVFKAANKIARTSVAKVVANFDSSKYFVTRGSLYVWPEFTLRILPAYQGLIPKRGIRGVEYIDMTRYLLYDREIVVEYLGGMEEVRKHAFAPDQLADLMDAQKEGKVGVLLNNGYANILYMVGMNEELFCVSMHWNSVQSHWDICAYEFDAGICYAGYRIFRNKN